MKFCSICGSKLNADDKFCRNCGRLVPSFEAPSTPVAEQAPSESAAPAEPIAPAAAAPKAAPLHGTPVGLLVFSIINTVLGLFGLCFCNFISPALGIWGIVSSALASNKPVSEGKNLCKISLIVNIIATALLFLWFIGYILYFAFIFSTFPEGGSYPGNF